MKGKLLLLLLALFILFSSTVFAEDQPSSWAEESISQLNSLELLREDAFKNYKKNITRGEFIYLAVRLYEVLSDDLIDVDSSISFNDTDDIYALKGATVGITSGIGNNNFGYDILLTREQLATLMINVLGLLDIEMTPSSKDIFDDDSHISIWAKDAIYLARSNKIISGTGNNNVSPKGNASVEVALIVTRNILSEKKDGLSIKTPDSDTFEELVIELSDEKYEGKKPGTLGYNKAANLLASKMEEFKLSYAVGSSFIQEYKTNLSTLDSEKLIIDSKRLEIMDQYMPFSRTSELRFNDKASLIFMEDGSEDKYNNIDVNGKFILFTYYDKYGKFPGGLMDRVLIAKSHGASGVFILANGELKVGHYEHPINNDDKGIYAVYLTETFVEESNIKTTSLGDKSDIDLDIEMKITRSENISSQNVLGKINGKSSAKTLILATNLDGFGSLPDGRTYSNTMYSVITPSMFIELAKHYSNNQPEYDIIFAIVGDKWTNHKGIEVALKSLSNKSIISVIDSYSIGNINNVINLGINQGANEDFKDKLRRKYPVSDMNDYGNALSKTIKKYTTNVLFHRGSNSWIDDAFSDTPLKVDFKASVSDINDYKVLIDDIMKTENMYSYNTKATTIYSDIAKRSYQSLETKYLTLLYDNEYSNQIENINFLMEMDIIYERMLKYNYEPLIKVRPIAIFSNDVISAARIGQRKDVYEDGHDTGGGFASFEKASVNVIHMKDVSMYTVSHEMNHLFVVKKLVEIIGSTNYSKVNEEAQGHTHIVNYSGLTFLHDQKNYLQKIFENKKVMDIVRDYDSGNKEAISWSFMTSSSLYDNYTTYKLFATMYDFVLYNYGEYAQRRTIFRVYEANSEEEYAKAFASESNLNPNEFMDAWVEWMLSAGSESTNKRITNTLNDYDLRWQANIRKIEEEYKKNYSLNTSKSVDINTNDGAIDRSNSASVTIEKNTSENIELNEVSETSYPVKIGFDSEYLILQVDLDSYPENPSFTLFLMGDTPGLYYSKSFNEHNSSYLIKIKKSLARTFTTGIVINPGNDDFILINKAIVGNNLD